MTGTVDRLKARLKAVRKLEARGGKGYFSHKNNELNDGWQDELSAIREKTAQRWKKLEQEAMTNILRGQRELERAAA